MLRQKIILKMASLIILLLSIMSCQPTASPTPITLGDEIQDIRVQMVEPIKTTADVEQFPLPNCGGTDKLGQSLGMYASITKNVTVGGKATVTGGGEVAIPETAKLKLEIQVELAYQQAYESANSRLDTIEMSAAAGTHVVYTIVWEEQIFESIVQYSADGRVYEAPYSYKLRVPKIDRSYNVECSSNSGGATITPVPPTVTPVAPKPTPTPNTVAIQKCEEFGGTPVSLDSITNEHIEIWRKIGRTDTSGTARVIYCEIHQAPDFRGFVEGDNIPAGVIITADLGFNWDNMYPGSLERLVHDGGGWGVFLSLKPFVVQHADDLPNVIGGQYWFVSQ